MGEHPIENLMVTAMSSIQGMIDVNTIIGEPIETSSNVTIIPISKVSFGFAAGGSEFTGETIDEYSKKDKEEEIQYRLPFGGGAGAGVSINAVAFLVIQNGNVKLIPVSHTSSIDKLLDYVPDLIEKTNSIINSCIENKKTKTQAILQKLQNKQNEQKNKDKVVKKEIKTKVTDDNDKNKIKEEIVEEKINLDDE